MFFFLFASVGTACSAFKTVTEFSGALVAALKPVAGVAVCVYRVPIPEWQRFIAIVEVVCLSRYIPRKTGLGHKPKTTYFFGARVCGKAGISYCGWML
jgi:hypothetical protein